MDIKGLVESMREQVENLGGTTRCLVGAALIIGAGAKIVAAAATSAQDANDVGAERFSLRDKHGQTRAVLGIRPDGTTGLGILDQDGKVRLGIEVKADGTAGLSIWDRDGNDRGELLVGPDGTPTLDLRDKEGKVQFHAP